jgi:hypothetical protein
MPVDALCERVVRVLSERAARVEVLDRDLRLDGERTADFVGVESDGRLVIGVVSEVGDEALFLAAISALIFARANVAALVQHLRATGLRAELDPRVMAIALRFEVGTLARLRTLDPAAVHAFELRIVESRRGRSDVLAPLIARAETGVLEVHGMPAPLAEQLARRIARIDGELTRTAAGEVVQWRWHGHTLCTVTSEAGVLEGAIVGVPRSFALNDESDCGAFLDAVTRRYLTLVPQPVPTEASGLTPLTELEVVPASARRGAR